MNRKLRDLPYYGTNVSVRDTVTNIKELLDKYGLLGTQITEYGKTFKLIFALEHDNKKSAFQFEMTRPDNPKEERQKFRAFYWHLKSRLEAVEFGLFTMQDVFMPEMLIQLPDGDITTIKKALKQNNQKLLPVGSDYFGD